ncbi:MAG: polysaccharide biosynthesis C-terminal domain-containing protein [Ruminococcus sp.]
MRADPFSFLNLTLTGLFTAQGDSSSPLMANLLGLVGNMILDPLLILGVGPFPRMETTGAAVATVTAQILAFRSSGIPDPYFQDGTEYSP